MVDERPRISIHQIIVHKIDHKTRDAAWLSDLETPLDDEIISFLTRHILDSREHQYARNGLFREEDAPSVLRTLCDDLVSDRALFVPRSQDIARLLFEAIGGDKRVSSGDLVIVTFSEPQDEAISVALLKMDPQSGLIGEPRDLGDGRTQFVLRQVSEGVLTTSDLQKSAFILPQSRRTRERDLVVLDQQSGKYGARRMIASFFVTRFLNCSVDLNAREKTTLFRRHTLAWSRTQHAHWSEEDKANFDTRIEAAVQAPFINVVEVARDAIPNEVERDAYVDHMRQQLQREGFDGLAFSVDQRAARKQRYVRIRGDHGLELRITAEAFARHVDVALDEATNTHIITIRTTQFEQDERLL